MFKWWRAATATATAMRSVAATPQRCSSSSSTAAYQTIEAFRRVGPTGSKSSAFYSARGRIPIVVLKQKILWDQKIDGSEDDFVITRSVSDDHLLTTERKQIESLMESVRPEFFCTTLFHLRILAGPGSSTVLESGSVLPRKIHRDQESGQVMNLVFVWATEGLLFKVDVPIVFKGEDVCPGLKKGGHLTKLRPSLRYVCPAKHIPPYVEADVSNLDIGGKVMMHDVLVHPLMKLANKSEILPVCKVVVPSPNYWDAAKPVLHLKGTCARGRRL